MLKSEVNNFKIFKKAVGLSVVIFLVGAMVFICFEPAVINATYSPTATTTVSANVTAEFSVTAPGTLPLSPDIPGMTGSGGTPSTGSETFTVITNNSTGFNMKINAGSDTPAALVDQNSIQGNYYFSDYTTTPTYSWSHPSQGAAVFGYTVNPATAGDKAQAFKDNSSNACGSNYTHETSNTCWSGLTASPVTVISHSGPTSSTGEAEQVVFNAESNKFLTSGSYSSTVVVTASTP